MSSRGAGAAPGDRPRVRRGRHTRARISRQAPREQRLATATHVIDNSGTFDDLVPQIERLWTELTSLPQLPADFELPAPPPKADGRRAEHASPPIRSTAAGRRGADTRRSGGPTGRHGSRRSVGATCNRTSRRGAVGPRWSPAGCPPAEPSREAPSPRATRSRTARRRRGSGSRPNARRTRAAPNRRRPSASTAPPARPAAPATSTTRQKPVVGTGKPAVIVTSAVATGVSLVPRNTLVRNRPSTPVTATYTGSGLRVGT